MKTLEEQKQETREKIIRDAEWEVNYHRGKLEEAELKLKAVLELVKNK